MKNTKIHLALSDKGRKIKIPTDLPVLFLAGPSRNAPRWQEEAISFLLNKDKQIFVASPTREIRSDLRPYIEVDKPEYEVFERQRAWEQYYLYAAASRGCIVFWLPKESSEKEYTDKVYAHITMMELGEWIARKKIDEKINLVIGTDGNFPEWRTIEYEIKTEIPTVPVCKSLQETIETSLNLSNKK